MRYLVRFATHSNKFNEDYIASQTTKDLDKFCQTHKVVEAWECKGRNGQLQLGKKVIG